jgi:WD40 repeat protein
MLHKNYVTSLAFSPDAKRVVSGSWDMTIRIWNADTGQILFGPLKGHVGGVNCVAFAPDGGHIVSGSDDRTVRIWDAETEKIISTSLTGHADQVTTVAFSPDGMRVASGSDDRMVRIWDAKTGKTLLGPLEGHTGPITTTTFSLSGRRIVSGSVDRTIRVWDAVTGQLLSAPLGGHKGTVSSVSFSPDETWLVSSAVDQTIRVWNVDPIESVNLHFSDEWMLSNPLLLNSQNREMRDNSQRLFWVPPGFRKGICGKETISIMGVSLTRADFSRFVYGMSWEQCRTPNDADRRGTTASLVPFVRSQARHFNIAFILVLLVSAPSILVYSYLQF